MSTQRYLVSVRRTNITKVLVDAPTARAAVLQLADTLENDMDFDLAGKRVEAFGYWDSSDCAHATFI